MRISLPFEWQHNERPRAVAERWGLPAARRDTQPLNDTLIPGTDIAGYRLVNGRLAWSDVLGSKITAAAYVRNLFNQRYYTGGNGTGLSAGFNSAYPGVPRMYGLEVSVGF